MMTNSLENIDHEDLDDLLNKVEKSFHIKFVEGELTSGITFGSLISFIVDSRFAIPGIAFSLMGLWLANKWANELSLKTLGDLARQLT